MNKYSKGFFSRTTCRINSRGSWRNLAGKSHTEQTYSYDRFHIIQSNTPTIKGIHMYNKSSRVFFFIHHRVGRHTTLTGNCPGQFSFDLYRFDRETIALLTKCYALFKKSRATNRENPTGTRVPRTILTTSPATITSTATETYLYQQHSHSPRRH